MANIILLISGMTTERIETRHNVIVKRKTSMKQMNVSGLRNKWRRNKAEHIGYKGSMK